MSQLRPSPRDLRSVRPRPEIAVPDPETGDQVQVRVQDRVQDQDQVLELLNKHHLCRLIQYILCLD